MAEKRLVTRPCMLLPPIEPLLPHSLAIRSHVELAKVKAAQVFVCFDSRVCLRCALLQATSPAVQEYLQRVEKEVLARVWLNQCALCPLTSNVQVQDYRAGCDAASSAVKELEQQKSKIKAELAEVRLFLSCKSIACDVAFKLIYLSVVGYQVPRRN